MNLELLIAATSNIIIAIVCIGLSLRLVKGRVKMNKWYGVRFPKSYVSEDNWRKINEYGGKALIGWSIPVLILGLIMLPLGIMRGPTEPKDIAWIIPLSLSDLLPLGALVQTVIWSKRLPAKEKC